MKVIHISKLLVGTFIALSLAFLASPAPAQGPTPTDDEVNRIAKQLYCPVCESTPLDVCPTEACRQWRDLIRTMLAEGKGEEEIKQYFVTQYGVRVLDEPPNLLITYLVPGVAILAGAVLLLRGSSRFPERATKRLDRGMSPRRKGSDTHQEH